MLGTHGSAQKLENLHEENHLQIRGLSMLGQQVPRKRLRESGWALGC